MKIVHISHLYYPSAGGVQTYMKNISERLVKDYKDDVTVVTTNSYYGPEKVFFKKITPSQEIIHGVKVIRFPYRRWHIRPYRFIRKVLTRLGITTSEEMRMQLYGPCSGSMKRFLMTMPADVFFASSSNYYYMQLPLWRRCRFLYFASIHLDEDERNDHIMKRQIDTMNAATLYIANTQFEKNRMAAHGVHPDKIMVIGCGVDMAPFANVDEGVVKAFKLTQGIPENALVVGYAGRIEKMKNVQLLIEAFEKIALKQPDAYLLIAGAGSSYVNELKHYAGSLPQEINERIKWIPEFTAGEKAVLFHSFDILVLPSKNESFGIVFLEAWSCRKPVIGSSIGAVKDVINDGKDGLIATTDDADDLAKKLDMLLADQVLRNEMGENGFRKVQENYTWDIIVSKLRKLYANEPLQANSRLQMSQCEL